MILQRATFFVDGMTCPACESRISGCLSALEGVMRAEARLQGGRVSVEYDGSLVDPEAMKAAIQKAGYFVREKKGAGTTVAVGIGLLLAAGYFMASAGGLFNSLPAVDASIGYAMLLVIGLLTSIHCVAMCGGIALSQSIRAKPYPAADGEGRFERLLPGLLYNSGRVLSYTLIGGIAGAAGAAFSFSATAKGAIAAAAGLLMVFFGLRMLGVLKSFPNFPRLLPRGLNGRWMKFASSIGRRGPLAVGFLNGLMPCGPLQTMQLYALGTGSALAGAFSMFVFSLGTVPLMLLFSATATFLPRKFVPAMVKASAVLVMFLGVVTFTRAAALAGIPLPEIPGFSSGSAEAIGPAEGGVIRAAVTADGSQSVLTEFKDGYYVPFVVQAGVPVKWTIRIKEEDINGCNNPLVVPAYGIRKELVPGDNLVEFTPGKAGTIAYSCWMGMINSRISVVTDLASGEVPADQGNLSDRLDPGTAGSGSCCSGTGDPAFADGRVPADTIGMPTIRDGIQEITIDVTARGYSPAAIVLQRGMKAIIKFNPVELTSCNSPVIFPEFNGSLDLARGRLETPPITISDDFTFRCWMGMLHGYVKVVDDLSKVDLGKVKAEIGGYRASGGGCCGGAS